MSEKKNRITKTPAQLQAALDDLRAWSEKHGIVIFDWHDACFFLDREEDTEFGGAWDGYYLDQEEGGLILLSSYDNEVSHGACISSRIEGSSERARARADEEDGLGLIVVPKVGGQG